MDPARTLLPAAVYAVAEENAVELQVWAAFAGAAFLMAVIPGPGVASITGFAFTSGRTTALASVAGMAVGNAAAMTVSLAGAATVLASSALAFTLLKWIGAAYLIGMGLIAFANSGEVAGGTATARRIGPRAAFLTNVAVGALPAKISAATSPGTQLRELISFGRSAIATN
jgi:threonine/homoserine/homoserine lactone efflux protein